ncbi:MAG: hypothetical protein AAGA60_02630 [Cyanobacteria bacterium P01_E01_bin.42]
MTEFQRSPSDRYNNIINNLKKINEENSQVLKQSTPEERATLSPLLDRLKLQEEVATLYILLPKIRKLLIKIDREAESGNGQSRRAKQNQIRKDELEILLQHTENAIDLLTYGHPSIYLAKEIRINIQKTLNFYDRRQPWSFCLNRWVDFCNSKSDPLKVVMGLLISTPIFLALFAIALYYLSVGQNQLKVQIEATRRALLIGQYRDDPDVSSQESSIFGPKVKTQIQSEIQKTLSNTPLDLEGLSPNEKKLLQEEIEKRKLSQLEETQQDYALLFFLLLVACSGAFGSIISLFIRMHDFEEKEYSNPLVLLLTGALKPLIGAIFGLLLCGVLKSGILTIRIEAAPEQHKSDELLFCSLAFVVGFSERLAKDVIKRTENTLLGSSERQLPPREETRQEENQDNS